MTPRIGSTKRGPRTFHRETRLAKNRRDLRLGTGHTFGFVRHDPTDGFAEFVLVAPDDAGDVVACAHFVPFVLGDSALPVNGCDVVNGNRLLVHLGGQGARRDLRARADVDLRVPGARRRPARRPVTSGARPGW